MSSNETLLDSLPGEENPNNMIVSDVLKGRLPEQFFEEIQEKDQDVRVVLTGTGENKTFLKITSMHESDKGWSIVGVTTKLNALKVMRSTRETWRNIAVMYGATDVIKEMKINLDNFRMGVDFPDPGGSYNSDCVVTLACLEQ